MLLKSIAPWNVLVLPADSETGLAIHHALSSAKEVRLHGAVGSPKSAASFYYSRLHMFSALDDASRQAELQRIIGDHDIDAVMPADQESLLWLTCYRDRLGAAVIAPAYQDCLACQGLFKTPALLPDTTHTVSCFSAHSGKLLYAQARKDVAPGFQQRIDLPDAWPQAAKLSEQYALHGAWSFRLGQDAAGHFHVIDIAPRLTGGMAFDHATGPNLALLNLYVAANYDVEIDFSPAHFHMGEVSISKFIINDPIQALYIDLDGSLILRDSVNVKLMALIFQCRNRGIPVHLLTRHQGDLETTLDRYRLRHVFDTVIHLTDVQVPKAHFIPEANAVLIDDSFRERHETFKLRGIRCFDPAAALCLLDERDT